VSKQEFKMEPIMKSRFHISLYCIPETAFPYPQANVRCAHDSLFAIAQWVHSFFTLSQM
jgi:hypothetical protein